MLIEKLNENIAAILKNEQVTADMLDTNINFSPNNGMQIGYKILRAANLPIKYALIALYGPIVEPVCEHELSDITGFGEMYDSACVRCCISLAEKWISDKHYCEVGMKYPTFSPATFINTWKLTRIGNHQSANSQTVHEIWENPDNTMIWSCEKGRMGRGGYAGLIFSSFDKAVSFVDWFLGQPAHSVKDIDMFINGLGGVNIDKYKDFQLAREKVNR
jgi:hypothetical protein